MHEFKPMPKMSRLTRQCVITEKIDGTNASIYIDLNDDTFLTGSRTRWITPENDNHGFSRWAHEHKEELIAGLGHGHHFGEWWGQGIQRRYGLTEKRFSLFNVGRWNEGNKPRCCHLVPVLAEGHFSDELVQSMLKLLQQSGSAAAPGFMNPEGIVVYHTAAKTLFKKTLEKDQEGKGQ